MPDGAAYFSRDELLGGLTLSNVRRGVTQAAVLGYWLGLPFVRRGYMTEAVAAIATFAFEDLRLHRLEAATMPNNAGSIRGQFGTEVTFNLVHGSDSPESSEREIRIWFPEL